MRKLAYVVGGVAAGGVAALLTLGGVPPYAQQTRTVADSIVAPVLSASDTGSLKGPRQPIFFRHDIHAGQYKMQCQYCHYSVMVSPEPGIPTVQTCMGCHLVIGGTDSSHQTEIKKLRQAWTQKKPIEWVRVHYLARHAHFPHQRHVKAMGPTACATCHGDVQRMPQVFKVNKVDNMGFCITCHIERKVSRDCSVCHY
ncbi:MAG: cytochrome c3 family protein [Gemmatimonadales bacterium]|nr:cytochrome c3 family protein [Gemmatimonadales bacterium]MDQ3207959.1 cytochrome c family protein [Gemmatimonadota bacterium]